MGMNDVTNAADIQLPIEIVELRHLKTKNGDPVKVLCGGADELVLQRLTKALPGAKPPVMADDSPIKDDASLAYVDQIKAIAPTLIEAGTAFSDGNGGEIRPAFFWNQANAAPGSINGRLLRIEDLNNLIAAILRAGGYLPQILPDGQDGSFHSE